MHSFESLFFCTCMERVKNTFVDVFKLCRRHSTHASIHQVYIYLSFKNSYLFFKVFKVQANRDYSIDKEEMSHSKDGAGKDSTKGVAEIKNTK